MGHEAAGRVVEVGSDCDGWAVGTRVALETHLHCDDCYFCRSGDRHNCAAMGILGVTVDGVFADRVVVPARSCFALPDEIGLHVGALLEPAGSAMHGDPAAAPDSR
jgi:threonine 3-dehydrogenase